MLFIKSTDLYRLVYLKTNMIIKSRDVVFMKDRMSVWE